MDATDPAPLGACEWCGKDAFRTFELIPGSAKGAAIVRMPKTALVCPAHYSQFVAADEIGNHDIGTDW